MSCINCGDVFEERGGGYKRHSIQSKVRSTKECLLDVLVRQLNISLTPLHKSRATLKDRCLCTSCYLLVEKIERKQSEIDKKQQEIVQLRDEFNTRKRKGTYLDQRSTEGMDVCLYYMYLSCLGVVS
jgi:hypothetical protein